MEQNSLLTYATQYRQALLDDVIPFWERYSVDGQYGGYFTSLQRDGGVFDTDKFSWLQARQIWTFSLFYNQIEKREDWLNIAQNGIAFLERHGRNEAGHFYFSWDRTGRPLTEAYNIYSDCFAALAFAEYAKASGQDSALSIGLAAYRQFVDRQDRPKGRFTKTTSVRPLQSFGLPMMTAYLTHQLEAFLSPEAVESSYETCIEAILVQHYDQELGIIREQVGPDGSFLDSYEGRLINPGHGIEAMWFLMDIGYRLDRPRLIEQACEICLRTLAYGWDEEYGGIFYFLDSKGHPPQQLEWDRKLWWVHQEALIALATAYRYTRRADVWTWYQKVHQYTWARFPDPEYGEWYGYLNREGTPFLSLKGGKWKGCFHTPRALYKCWRTFQAMSH